MFSEVFSPYKHVLAALFRKQENNFPRLKSKQVCAAVLTILFSTAKPILLEFIKLPKFS